MLLVSLGPRTNNCGTSATNASRRQHSTQRHRKERQRERERETETKTELETERERETETKTELETERERERDEDRISHTVGSQNVAVIAWSQKPAPGRETPLACKRKHKPRSPLADFQTP